MINDYFSSSLSLNFGADSTSFTDFSFALATLDCARRKKRAGIDGFYAFFYGYDEERNIFR